MSSLAKVLSFPASPPAPSIVPTVKPRSVKTPIALDLIHIPYTYFLDDPHNPKPARNQILEAKNRKELLLIMAKYARKDGTNMVASVETLTFHARWTDRTTKTHKAALSAAGWVSITPRPNRTDLCRIHIPNHIWTSWRTELGIFKARQEKRRATKRVGETYVSEVGETYVSKVGETCDARVGETQTSHDLVCGISENNSLFISTGQGENKETLNDDGQKRNFKAEAEELAANLCNLSDDETVFGPLQIKQLVGLLEEGCDASEIKTAYGIRYGQVDTGSDRLTQLKWLPINFCATTAKQTITSIRTRKAEKAAQQKAIDKKLAEMQAESEAEQIVRDEAKKRDQELFEEELPD